MSLTELDLVEFFVREQLQWWYCKMPNGVNSIFIIYSPPVIKSNIMKFQVSINIGGK